MGGSSKKQTVGYKYLLGMHKILCHGPVDYVLEIRVDARLAWSGRVKQGQLTINKPSLFGGESREGGVSGTVDFESGGPTQGVNSYLASKLSSLVPAFRGVAGVVLRQVYVGMNPYLKKWSFRVKRIHTRQNGLKQWYDQKAEINGDAFAADPGDYTTQLGGSQLVAIDFNGQTWIAGGQDSNLIRSTDGGATWQPVAGSFINDLAANGSTWMAVPGAYDKVLRSLDDGLSFQLRQLPVFSNGITSPKCVAYGNGLWMLGGGYGGSGFVSTSSDGGETWSNIPGYSLPVTVTTLCHATGAVWLCTDINNRLHRSTNNGITWSRVGSYENCRRVRALPQGAFVLQYNQVAGVGSVLKSTDGGVTWTSHGAFAFSMQDITHLGDLLVIIGNGGRIAVSWDLGETWETLTQVLGGGVLLRAAQSDGEQNAYAVGDSGRVAKIKLIPARKGDLNPAHIIRECLTDPDWGMGYAEAEIDDTSFTAAADTLFSEAFGLSLLWDRQTPIEDFIEQVLKHIDGALYVDRKTGLFTLKLVRGGYNEATLLHLDESNIERVDNFTRTALGELTNSVTVNYWNTDTGNDASVTVQDIALIQMQQATINTTLQYPGITNAGLASRVAQRGLKTLSTPRVSCTIYTTRAAKDLAIGDVFKFSWPDFEVAEMVMRVTEMAYGDGRSHRIRITCTQDTFDLPSTEYVTPDAPEWEDPIQEPQPVTKQIAFEVPYRELVQLLGQASIDSLLASGPEIGFVGVAAARPEGVAINARVYVDAGAGYEDVAGVEFCPVADLTTGVDRFATVLDLTNLVDFTSVEAGTWAQLGEELVYVSSVGVNSVTVKRGILDTIPQDHSAGARIYFWDAFSAGGETEYLEGEILSVKLTPVSGSGQVDLADAAAMSTAIAGRAFRPYRPGNLKCNGEYAPELLPSLTWPAELTWASRNRLQDTAQAPVGYYEGSVTPEAGVEYELNVTALDASFQEVAVIHTATVAGESYSLAQSVILASAYGDAAYFKVGVKAVRNGVASWAEAYVLIKGFLQAPTTLTTVAEYY